MTSDSGSLSSLIVSRDLVSLSTMDASDSGNSFMELENIKSSCPVKSMKLRRLDS